MHHGSKNGLLYCYLTLGYFPSTPEDLPPNTPKCVSANRHTANTNGYPPSTYPRVSREYLLDASLC